MIQVIKEDKGDVPAATAEENPQPKAFIALSRVLQTLIFFQVVESTLVPDLTFLGKKYPIFMNYPKFLYVSLIVYCVSAFTCCVLLFLFRPKNDAAQALKCSVVRCSKLSCSRCDARRAHPRWFKFKYWLLFLFIYVVLVIFVICIQQFFAWDQTINLPRLLKLFSLQIGVITFNSIMWYYVKQYVLHNGPLETSDDCVDDEKKLLTEGDIV
ncbi:hypothetical protein SEUBUCD646_0C00760 [Saccharomyces eubayanus]|uniref:Uncharacterized protein n=2 Tax=Saccharomyces TaxID=4930 RepID=A0ABN8VPR1_SACEU|nr:hypothetical protein SEUBUCD650_0C00720 [Saccharomyces eubayanus]CAI1907686.1 hypothetical protein SEUBUCD646_0C00760 [Saccharomyces eubayanus]